MSSRHAIGYEPSVEAETLEQSGDGFEVVDEVAERERNSRPDVEREIQATIDYADDKALNGRLFGQTLEAQERMAAREWEIERTRVRWDRRVARCRRAVERVARERRIAFETRAASVDPWLDPKQADPREELTRAELAAVNREAARVAAKLDGWKRAAVSRRLAERVVDGAELTSAVLDAFERLRTAPGYVIPIEAVGAVRRQEVSVEGTVTTLWRPSHPCIQQVGLMEDGRTGSSSPSGGGATRRWCEKVTGSGFDPRRRAGIKAGVRSP